MQSSQGDDFSSASQQVIYEWVYARNRQDVIVDLELCSHTIWPTVKIPKQMTLPVMKLYDGCFMIVPDLGIYTMHASLNFLFLPCHCCVRLRIHVLSIINHPIPTRQHLSNLLYFYMWVKSSLSLAGVTIKMGYTIELSLVHLELTVTAVHSEQQRRSLTYSSKEIYIKLSRTHSKLHLENG